MKKRIVSLALTLAMLLALAPALPIATAADTFTPITGWDMMHELKLGLAIGNTLDASSAFVNNDSIPSELGLGFETLDGEIKITRELFNAIKLKGFNFVRIPVTWEPHVDKDYKINAEWMDRVEECVKWALDEGLYVILNTHHELTKVYMPMATGDYAGAKKYLTAVWAQIAERFKGYSERLIFETMNEPCLPGDWLWYYDEKDDAYYFYPGLIDNVNALNADALETIRNSGGNNAKRVVMLPTAGADYRAAEEYVHPENDEYILVSIHAYRPLSFTNWEDGAPVTYVDAHEVDEVFQVLNDVFISQGIPVLIDEVSTTDRNNTPERVKWVKHYFGKAAELGIPVEWWDCGVDMDPDGGVFMALINRIELRWLFPEILEAMFAAYGLKPGPDYTGPLPSVFPFELYGTYEWQHDGNGNVHGICHLLKGPYQDDTWTPLHIVQRGVTAAAERLVVEYEGELESAAFQRYHPYEGVYFYFLWDDSGRVVINPGTVIFDIRGTEGYSLEFYLNSTGDGLNIKRVYLDLWPAPSLSNFTRSQTYDDRFTDMNWSSDWVAKAYEYGIIAGTSATTYGTTGNMLIQDALVVASKIHAIYYTGSDSAATAGASYPTSFINYAIENGITDKRFEGRYNQAATRAELAYIWGRILPETELKRINTFEPVTDVNESHEHYQAIKLFYEAGIVTGNPDKTFKPNDPINRGECAVMFVRLVSERDRHKG